MSYAPPVAAVLDIQTESGTVRVESTGPADGKLVLCVHGLSGNLRVFDAIVAGIAHDERRVVALDLPGRGASPDTGPGTYGLDAHARTVLGVADELGAMQFDLVGWSMGGLVGLTAARLAPDRLRSLTLIDVAGAMDPAAVDVVRAGLARLDAVVEQPEQYLGAMRSVGLIDPWLPMWDAVYRYELGAGPSPRTSRSACEEDLLSLEPALAAEVPGLWAAVSMPSLVIRAEQPVGAGGLIVPDETLRAVTTAIPTLRVARSACNHWTVLTDPVAIDAIDSVLG